MAQALDDFRAKHTQYANVDDATLADALYKKYYSHADRREFDARIGLDPYDTGVELAGKVAQNIGPSITGSLQTTAVGAAEAVQDIVRGVPMGGGNPAAAPFTAIAEGAGAAARLLGLGDETDAAAEAVIQDQARKRAVNDLKQMLNAPDVAADSPGELAYNVLFAATDVAAPMAASVLLRNPGPMVAYGTLRSGAEGYEKARDAGLSTTEARAAAGLYAASEAATEYLGTKLLLEGGKTLVTSVLRGALSEGLTEGATEALNALIDAGVIGEDMTLEDAMKRVQMGATVGGILGGPLGGVGYLTKPKEQQATAEAISEDVLGAKPDEDVVTVEDSLALPAPETLLALPAPDAPPVVTRRQPAAPEQVAPAPAPEQEIDYQAQVALRKTRQAETAALLQTARETVAPLGSFTRDEVDAALLPKPATRTVNDKLQVKYGENGQWRDATIDPATGVISSPGADADQRRATGVSPTQRVMTWRAQTGRNMDAPITVEDMARAKVPQSVIDAVITARRPMTRGQVVVPNDIRAVAESKNIIADDDAFSELAFRTTGQRNIDRMSQAQLSVLKSTIESLPSHESRVTLPIADAPAFDEGQYNKSLDAIRNQGRFTLAAIKDAAGVKDDGIARSIRDAMVRRGQLVQRGKNDFRLYDVLGAERQAVPDDLPPGAFSEYVVKKTPVNRIQIKVGGKSIGTFGSGTEARNKIRELRAKEAEKGGTPSQIELGQAEESAYAVMENRYDEAGNLLGQVAVDTSRDETAARKLAEQRNNPDTGARYTQTLVTPEGVAQPAPKARPKRGPAPAALAGRVDEVITKLNAAAKERALPLLGTTVKVVDIAKAPNGEAVRGMYLNNVITITAGTLEPNLTTDQVVDRLAQVMDHELVHALKRAGVLSPESAAWKTLSKYVRKARRPDSGETYIQFTKRVYADAPGYTTETVMEEEAIAEAFRIWAANRRNVVGQPATAFRQLVEWFKRLFNALPNDIFISIESGAMVRDALTPPGAGQPRAVAAEEMAAARREIAAAQKAKDENAVRVASRSFLRARDQAREDRLGRSGPKTIIGTTPSRAFAASAPVPRNVVDDIVGKYRASAGISTKGLATLLPEDIDYLARIADAQQRAVHDPADDAVAKAYRALTTETKSMFDALGITEIARWTEDGQPYASVDEMFADMAAGRLKMRLSADMFGEGADNPGHPMYKASGVKAADGTPLVFNDLFRVVHDVYGRAPIGLKRDNGRDDYNAYHEHARLVSDDARKALATETLAQGAWHHYGPHLRRKDGTVPRERDVDYLPAERKEFAEQKAFLLDDKLLAADPGWALAEKADTAVADAGVEPTENARFMLAWHGTPHSVDRFSSKKIGTGEGAQAFGHGLYFAGKREVADHYRGALSPKAHGLIDGQRTVPTDVSLDGSGPALSFIESVGSIERAQAELRKAASESPSDRMRAHYTEAADWIDTYRDRLTVSGSGNLYKVDIPEDNELLDWDAPMREQPQNIQDAVARLLGTEIIGDMSGEDVYDSLSAKLAKRPPTGSLMERIGTKRPSPEAASEALKAAGIPGHRYFDSLSRDKADGSHNYVIYDDSRVQIVDVNPKFSLFDDHLPGGRLYGNAKRSPGGAVSPPETAPPAFSKQRDGNQFFGGDLANEQLRMAQVGERGTTMLYLSPDEFLALAGNPINPEQAVYDGLVNEGYKFNTLPSLVLDGYAGKVRAVESDGAYAVNALAGRAERIPVAIYPKRGENLGLVSAIDANGVSVPWPADGRAENYTEVRGPRSSVDSPAFKAWFGDSKVVNADGSPKVVYKGHYGDAENIAGFFSDSPNVASSFADSMSNLAPDLGGAVAPAYVRIEEPYVIDVGGKPAASVQFDSYADGWSKDEYETAMMDPTYDGVVLENTADEGTVYIVKSQKQVKSAIANKGTYDATNPDIRYSLNAPYGTRVPREQFNIIDQRVETWVGSRLARLGRSKRELPLPKGIKEAVGGSIFDMRVKFQDRMLSVKEMIENVETMGGVVTDATNVYIAEQLAGSRTVQEVEHREATLYDPLFKALEREAKADKPITAKELEDFLYARHAPERNAYLRAAGSKVANPSGMSDAEAEAILDKAALDGKLDRFEELAGFIDAITADTTNTRSASGLISPDTASQSPYQYYVPLRGKDAEDLDPDDVYDRPARARSGKGYTVGGKEDRSAVGRSRKAGDIIASVMLQNTESVIRSEKNRVALSFMRLLQANPNTGYGTILSSAPTRMVRGADGQIREAGDPSFRNQPDIFTAKWKGKEIVARVEDPRVARAMRADYVQTGGEPSILDKFVAGASRLNRYLATINTSWNAEFLLSNFLRDLQTAGILSTQYDVKGMTKKIVLGAPKNLMAIHEVLRKGTASSREAKYFQELQKAGGTTEFLGIHDLDMHIKRLRADAARTGWQPTARQAFNRIQTIGKLIDDYNKVAENTFRLGAYIAARDAGVSIDKAAYLAKNLTVNFNKGGEQKALMNSLYLFYNASIGGTFTLLNGLKNKRVQKLVAGIVVAGITMDALNRMMSGDDDENGIKDYDDIPDYVLETNWVFMAPWTEKGYISLPMPYGFNFFHNLGRNMSNAVSGSPAHNPGKSAMSTLMTAIDAFNPIGGANSPLNFIAPTFADPLVDLATNTDFAGNDIVPDRPTFGLDVPDSQKYWANTGEIPKWAAEQINRLTGGSEVRPGAIDVSPEVLQFWVDYATGATGKFIQRNVNLGMDLAAGNFEDIEIGDIPFARRVVGSVNNRGNTERYYENATEIKTVEAELELAQETGDRATLDRVLASKAPEVKLIETFAKAEKELSAMRKQIRELKADVVLPQDQKREMIRALEEQQDAMMAGLNRLYYETKGFALPAR